MFSYRSTRTSPRVDDDDLRVRDGFALGTDPSDVVRVRMVYPASEEGKCG